MSERRIVARKPPQDSLAHPRGPGCGGAGARSPLRGSPRGKAPACSFAPGLLLLATVGLVATVHAAHPVASWDLSSRGPQVVEAVGIAPTPPASRPTPASSSTAPSTTRALATTAASCPLPSEDRTDGLRLSRDGQWSLPAFVVPTGAAVVLEDLIWFRFEGDGFGRSRGWNGRVELVAFDPGGPRIAVRCSSTRRDGLMEYHDGQGWKPTGMVLREGVDYALRTVFRPAEGTMDVHLVEPSEPPEGGPRAPTTRSTSMPSTHDMRASPQQADTHGTCARAVLRPLPGPDRNVPILSRAPCGLLPRQTVRRLLRITGGPEFSTRIRRWQLWDRTLPMTSAVSASEGGKVASLEVARAVRVNGPVKLTHAAEGTVRATFEAQVGLHDSLRSETPWKTTFAEPIRHIQDVPMLALCGIGSRGDRALRKFRPPRTPFEVGVAFKLPPDLPPMRSIDLVRFVLEDGKTTIGPYVQVLAGMHDLKNGRWACRLAAQVGEPSPAVDGTPILLDTWYGLGLSVDPIAGTFTASLASWGKDPPPSLRTSTTGPTPAKTPTPPAKRAALFGGKPVKFFGVSRLPREIGWLFAAEGGFRTLGEPVELDAKPSIVLPLPNKSEPWTSPAAMADMTCREKWLEILSTHGGSSLIRIDLTEGTTRFLARFFGEKPAHAFDWDETLNGYWWVQPEGKYLAELRDPNGKPMTSKDRPGGETPQSSLEIAPEDDRKAVKGQGRLEATPEDLFFVTWDRGIYRVAGKTAPPTAFDYRKAFHKNLRYGGVACDDQILLLAGPYGVPNAGRILAVDLGSGQPIRRLSLRRHLQGITAVAGDGARLFALGAADRVILSTDWPTPNTLGLIRPVLFVGRMDVAAVHERTEWSLLPPEEGLPAWKGKITEAGTAPSGHKKYQITQAVLDDPKPTFLVGRTLGQVRWLELRLHSTAPAQALQISLTTKPSGVAKRFYVALVDPDVAQASADIPSPCTAKQFFASNEVLPDAFSALRKFKPPADTDPVFVYPAKKGAMDVALDLLDSIGMEADAWMGTIALRSIGPPCTVEHLDVRADASVHVGAMTGSLLGDVVDLGHIGCRLIGWEIDGEGIDERDDEATLSVRTANARVELPERAWRAMPRPVPPTGPTTTSAATSIRAEPMPLGRFLQWRMGLTTESLHDPPAVSRIRLRLAGGRPAEQGAPSPQPYQDWRTWWPIIFAVPVACFLIWFAFLRGSATDRDPRSS